MSIGHQELCTCQKKFSIKGYAPCRPKLQNDIFNSKKRDIEFTISTAALHIFLKN